MGEIVEYKPGKYLRRFVPKTKELFYFVTMGHSGFNVSGHLFGDDWNDKERVAFGNSFESRDEAEFVKDKLNALFKGFL